MSTPFSKFEQELLRRGLHHGPSHRSWLGWTTTEIQRLRIAVVVAPSKDCRAICEGVVAVDADTGSPAEGCADVKGLREIAAQQPGAVEACAARRPPCLCSGTRLRQLAQVQAGVPHERNVILTVQFHEVPWIGLDKRVAVEPLGRNFWRVTLHFGFMNTPDVPRALALCETHGLRIPLFETSYFVSRETVVPTPGSGMANWRERLFATMSRNAGSVVEFFRLPDNAVVELGTRVQI